MNIRRFTAIAVVFVFAGFAAKLGADMLEVSSKRLIEHAKFYDGKTITYKGEAVTALMKRGDYGWVNVHDGENAIGVWAPVSLLDPIKYVGNYKARGDTIKVVGVFNRSCQEHGGDLDIHADSITIDKTGHALHETVDKQKLHIAFFLFLITIIIVVVFRKRI